MSGWLHRISNTFQVHPTEPAIDPRLVEQIRRFNENELREVPIVRQMTRETAAGWRDVMLGASGGREPNLATDALSIKERDDFLNRYFTPRRMAEVKAEMIPKRPERPINGWRRFKHRILTDRLVPLFFRLAILLISIVGLVLAGILFQQVKPITSSTIFIVAWPTIAIVFTLVVMTDEFLSPPIGLRPAFTKLSITLADLFFIMLNIANLTITFSLILDGPVCHTSPKQLRQCKLSHALCVILFFGAVAWTITFSVTLVRLVSAVSGMTDDTQPEPLRPLITEPVSDERHSH